MTSNIYSITITSNEQHTEISDELEQKFKNRDRSSSKCVEKIRSIKENTEEERSKKILNSAHKDSSPFRNLEILKPKSSGSRHNSNYGKNSLTFSKKKEKKKSEEIVIKGKPDEMEMLINDCISKGFEFEQTFEELEKLKYIKREVKDNLQNIDETQELKELAKLPIKNASSSTLSDSNNNNA